MSSDDELSSNTLSSCDVESLQLAVEGEGSFNRPHGYFCQDGKGKWNYFWSLLAQVGLDINH